VNETAPRALVPPRPNLGPEPWSEPEPIAGVCLLAGLLAALFLAAGFLTLRRRARARAARSRVASQPQVDATPRGQLVALSDSIRQDLTNRFGTAWRAKTTEELSADSLLVQALGRQHLDELIRFLDQIDRLKFAPARLDREDGALEAALSSWEPRVTELRAKLRTKRRGRL
jgi:hypothetical protein